VTSNWSGIAEVAVKRTLATFSFLLLCLDSGEAARADSAKVSTAKQMPKFSSDSTMGTNSSFSGTTYAPPTRRFNSDDVPTSFGAATGTAGSTNPTPHAEAPKEQSFVIEGAHKSFQSDEHGIGPKRHFMNGSSANSQFKNGSAAGSQFSKGANVPTSGLAAPVEYARGADGTYRPKSTASSAEAATKSGR
jgi:hypothetical protein